MIVLETTRDFIELWAMFGVFFFMGCWCGKIHTEDKIRKKLRNKKRKNISEDEEL
jgi:hypothetical protein